MDVEHEASDRHRRITAVMDELVPVRVAKLGDVHLERGQEIERVTRRHCTVRERLPERHGFRLAVSLAEQFGLEQIEMGKLLVRTECRVVGDVVGGADKIVERHNHRPVARVEDP